MLLVDGNDLSGHSADHRILADIFHHDCIGANDTVVAQYDVPENLGACGDPDAVAQRRGVCSPARPNGHLLIDITVRTDGFGIDDRAKTVLNKKPGTNVYRKNIET